MRRTQSLLAVLLVVLEVAFEPVHVAITLESEDVRADAIYAEFEPMIANSRVSRVRGFR